MLVMSETIIDVAEHICTVPFHYFRANVPYFASRSANRSTCHDKRMFYVPVAPRKIFPNML